MGSINKRIVTGLRKTIIPPCTALLKQHLELSDQSGVRQDGRSIFKLDSAVLGCKDGQRTANHERGWSRLACRRKGWQIFNCIFSNLTEHNKDKIRLSLQVQGEWIKGNGQKLQKQKFYLATKNKKLMRKTKPGTCCSQRWWNLRDIQI